MKKLYMFSMTFYMIFLQVLTIDARKNRANFTFFAPNYSNNQIQQTPKFQSCFTDESQYLVTIEQSNHINYISNVFSPEKEHQSLGFFAGWIKNRRDKKAAKKIEKAQASLLKTKSKQLSDESQQKCTVLPQPLVAGINKKSNITLQEIKKLTECNNQILRAPYNQDVSFKQNIENRSIALKKTLQNSIPTVQSIKINSQTAGFLQAQEINTAQFLSVEGVPIQHQLTHELLDVLDTVIDYALQHRHEMYQDHMIKYCAHLASLIQLMSKRIRSHYPDSEKF